MAIGLLLVILGLILALLLHPWLGVVLIVIGLVLIFSPAVSWRPRR